MRRVGDLPNKWSRAELWVALMTSKLGWVLIKSQDHYTIYDDPDLVGAFTVHNEITWSRDLAELRTFLKDERERRLTEKTTARTGLTRRVLELWRYRKHNSIIAIAKELGISEIRVHSIVNKEIREMRTEMSINNK